MALHDWIKREMQGGDRGDSAGEERWKSEFGELSSFQLAQGMIPPHGDPDKPRPDIEAINRASEETIAREINDPYWAQPESATKVPEPPSDTDIFVRATERYATPKHARDWKQAIRDEERIRAEARAELEQSAQPEPEPEDEWEQVPDIEDVYADWGRPAGVAPPSKAEIQDRMDALDELQQSEEAWDED
jgi:hypothetical protein